MTKWKINGKAVDEEDVPYYLDDIRFDFLKDDFENEFNEANTAAYVLYDYAGPDSYHEEFQKWIKDKMGRNPRYFDGIDGVERTSASVRSKSSSSCRSKSAPKSKSTRSAKPKNSAKKGRC